MTGRLLVLIALALPTLALAQFRNIPAEAKRGEIRHVGQMDIEIDGRRMRLSPGSQIRDAENRLLVPMALPAGSIVKYQLDPQSLVHRVWILSPQEIAQPDPKR